MSISALWNGISGFFVQIGDFFVMLWDMLTSHIELLGRYITWMVKSIPLLLSWLTRGWTYISKVLTGMPTPVVTAIGLVIIIPFVVLGVKVVSKL